MNKIANPFLIYGYINPDYFCDRMEETNRLCSALRNGRNVTLISPRRMGKTGLIKNAFYHINHEDPEAVCFYMDIFSTSGLSDFIIQFGQTVIGKLDTLPQKAFHALTSFFKSSRLVLGTDSLNGTPQITLDFMPAQADNTLREIFEYLRQSERECYIAIDEFQQITEYPEKGVEGLLRSYIQFLPNVHFIFSGSKQHVMNEMFSSAKRPFYQSTEKMSLQAIDEKEYFTFADYRMSEADKKLGKDVFHELYSRFEGHTWYVQYTLNKLFEHVDTELTLRTLKQCIEEIIYSEEASYQQLYGMLTDNQSTLLRAIAREGIVTAINGTSFISKYHLKGTSSINAALRFLIDKEYVYKNGNTYQIYDRFMALWLQTLPF
jgi:AAA+ ATPase superfamily predicted ATPase